MNFSNRFGFPKGIYNRLKKENQMLNKPPEGNQIPNVDREQPDFRCKFSKGISEEIKLVLKIPLNKNTVRTCQIHTIHCQGLAADRKRCPYWNK